MVLATMECQMDAVMISFLGTSGVNGLIQNILMVSMEKRSLIEEALSLELALTYNHDLTTSYFLVSAYEGRWPPLFLSA